MKHPNYRDEPTADEPFTKIEWEQFLWVSAWRDAYHKIEEEMYHNPDIRNGLLLGLSVRLPTTRFED